MVGRDKEGVPGEFGMFAPPGAKQVIGRCEPGAALARSGGRARCLGCLEASERNPRGSQQHQPTILRRLLLFPLRRRQGRIQVRTSILSFMAFPMCGIIPYHRSVPDEVSFSTYKPAPL